MNQDMALGIPAVPPALPPVSPEQASFPTLRELEREHITRVLAAVGGNQRRAARILGISRWSLARRLRKYRLHVGNVCH